jgi:N-methylhydantoinase A
VSGTETTTGTDIVIGVDVGGTFTDVALLQPGSAPVLAKILTTPSDPCDGIVAGIREVLGRSGADARAVARVVHGTTLATNTILERRGSRVVLVTTEGFGDLLHLGRAARVEEDRYDLRFSADMGRLTTDAIFEAPERVDAGGQIVRALTPDAARLVAEQVRASQPEAIAICLLHSWANSAHEEMLEAAISAAIPGAYVSRSSAIWPEIREFDRAATTVVSAYVGPAMSSYLRRLGEALRSLGISRDIWVMDSAGGVMGVETAARRPAMTIESGGAAGMQAAARLARTMTNGAAISFDMGGTTAKAGVITGGEPEITHQFQVGGKGSFGVARPGTGLPVKGPVVDLAEVGAGGGSIASVDRGGSLAVGPRSASARPGPACYGFGGVEPTVTDANLVLGVLGEGDLSGGVSLSLAAAEAALARSVAGPLGISVVDAAVAVRDIAIAHMAGAIRVVTVQRGLDPADYPLIAFGGAGPMHAAALAELFGIDRVLVPAGAGVASALGLSAASPAVERVRTRPMLASPETIADAVAIVTQLQCEALSEITAGADRAVVRWSIDMRFVGQAHDLTVDGQGLDGPDGFALVRGRFLDRYASVYGVEADAPAQFVTFRVRVAVPTVDAADIARGADVDAASAPTRRVHFGSEHGEAMTPIVDWSTRADGWCHAGPLVLTGGGSTVLVPPTWTVTVRAGGHLALERTDP